MVATVVDDIAASPGVSTNCECDEDVGLDREGIVNRIDDNKDNTDGVIRHLISRVECGTGVVVVSQDWSCWLSTLVARREPEEQ